MKELSNDDIKQVSGGFLGTLLFLLGASVGTAVVRPDLTEKMFGFNIYETFPSLKSLRTWFHEHVH